MDEKKGNFISCETNAWASAKMPQWLKSLVELLSAEQIKFIYDVCSKIMYESQVKKHEKARVHEIKRMAERMKVDFKLLVEKLKDNVSSRQRFLVLYPGWRKLRDRNVEQLRKIANSIDAKRQESQDSKIIWGIVSIIGGGIGLVAGGNVSKALGTVAVGLGTLVTAGTIADESKSLRENIKEAEEIVKLDKEYVEKLVRWINDASCLQKALDSFESVHRNKDIRMTAEKLRNISKKNLNPTRSKKEIEMVLKNFGFSPELREEISDTVGILISFYMLFENFCHVFRLVVDTESEFRFSMDLIRTAYAGINTISAVKNVGGGILLNAIDILLIASQDPKSSEGKEIRKIASELEKEANLFKNVFDEMK